MCCRMLLWQIVDGPGYHTGDKFLLHPFVRACLCEKIVDLIDFFNHIYVARKFKFLDSVVFLLVHLFQNFLTSCSAHRRLQDTWAHSVASVLLLNEAALQSFCPQLSPVARRQRLWIMLEWTDIFQPVHQPRTPILWNNICQLLDLNGRLNWKLLELNVQLRMLNGRRKSLFLEFVWG